MTENSKDNLSPDDYYSLGNLYQYGNDEDDDFAQDYDMAFFCYEQAAKKGHAESQLALGLMYNNGKGVTLDLDEAIKWIRKAAKRGSTNAQDYLPSLEGLLAINEDDAEGYFISAGCYSGRITNSPLEKDLERAAFWCRKAVEQGHEEAEELLSLLESMLGDVEEIFGMAMSYYFGSDYIEKNREDAESLFRLAARKNHAGAKYMLAQMYIDGEGNHSDEYDIFSLFRESAKQGDVDAQFKLGFMYTNGEKVEPDYEKALFWTKKAADQGNVAAQYVLGVFYQNGIGVEVDQEEAVFWLSKAAEQGHEEAQSLLYDSDVDDAIENDDEPDFEQKLSLAKQGDLGAQFGLATAYYFGTTDEIAQDYDQAAFWFKKTLNHPDLNACPDVIPIAQSLLGVIYQDKGEIDEALAWYQQAAEKGNDTAQSQLGKIYLLGQFGIEKDESKALFWFLKAAEQGDLNSQNNLTYMYLNGCGVEIDNEQAAFWCKESAELGRADSQRNLGVMYKQGQGLKQSDKKAVFWYEKAAEQDDADAQAYLGESYYTGSGVEQDYEKAAFWFLKSAEQGQEDAQNKLGSMYAEGTGLEKNETKAIFWYQKAADLGQENAQKNLDEMKNGNSPVDSKYISITVTVPLLKDEATQDFEDMF